LKEILGVSLVWSCINGRFGKRGDVLSQQNCKLDQGIDKQDFLYIRVKERLALTGALDKSDEYLY